MNLKPIEPGCAAVIINDPDYEGQQVTVLEDFGRDEFARSDGTTYFDNVWKVDKTFLTWSGMKTDHLPGRNLLRIDGHEPDEQDEEFARMVSNHAGAACSRTGPQR
jgi:hypothetical protein